MADAKDSAGKVDTREVVIRGKRYRFRDEFPTGKGWGVVERLLKLNLARAYTVVDLACVLVEEWDHAGDPSEAANYDNLCEYRDLFPLAGAMKQHLDALLEDAPKN